MSNDPTILIVDDNQDNRTLLRLYLNSEPYQLLECENGAEAVDLVKEKAIDLILMDIRMPVMDGLEATRLIRLKNAHLPIMFCTANDSSEVLSQAFKVGGNDFIAKPVKRIELVRRVENLLQINLYRKKIDAQLKLFQRFVPKIFLDHDKFLNINTEHAFDVSCYQEEIYSALFMDIRQFTNFCEQLSSREVFNFLNSYFKNMGPVISKFGGFIYQYLGDGILALFPPSSGQNSDSVLHAAVSLIDTLKIYNRGRERAGYDKIRAGIGINTGSIALGIAGTQEQMSSGAFGNTINVASRCEELCKKYQADIIVTETTIKSLKNSEAFLYRYLGKEVIRGLNAPIGVYEIYSCNDPEIRDSKKQYDQILSDIMHSYESNQNKFQQRWINEMNSVIEKFPEDPLPKILKEEKLMQNFNN